MSGILMRSKPYIDKEKEELKREIANMEEVPATLIVRVGENQDSIKYVNNKIKMSEEVGAETIVQVFPDDITEDELIEYIEGYVNYTPKIKGCIIQLPLPKHINENRVLDALSYEKDVDGFSKENLGRLVRNEDTIVACTPKGIIDLLKYYEIEIEGKDVVIINRSTIVGKPLSLLFLNENATVTVCHSKTSDINSKVWNADIVVTAVGIPNFFKNRHFKPDTTIIDVAMNVDEDGKLCGDVCKNDYEKLLQKNCNITPVPGGVGSMTVLSLLKNTIENTKRKR